MRRNGSRLNDAGFTLVELMTVVGVIAALVLIATPVYLSAEDTTRKRVCFQNQNTLARPSSILG